MSFPVEEKIDEIRRSLAANRTVVLTAPPGSGKTTCVPPALLEEPWLKGRKIVMLEPRRLAARTCATWMARRRGEEGDVVVQVGPGGGQGRVEIVDKLIDLLVIQSVVHQFSPAGFRVAVQLRL